MKKNKEIRLLEWWRSEDILKVIFEQITNSVLHVNDYKYFHITRVTFPPWNGTSLAKQALPRGLPNMMAICGAPEGWLINAPKGNITGRNKLHVLSRIWTWPLDHSRWTSRLLCSPSDHFTHVLLHILQVNLLLINSYFFLYFIAMATLLFENKSERFPFAEK